MKLKEEGEEERVVEDGRKMVGGWEMRGGLRGVPSGAVVSDCIVCLALCEREGYVRF